ncbi:hypothetical protein AGMMS49928_24270 [Spirochaetia bacterium]|nr:hypothetical protein AGMMS49928_24270 [Spirochaetia bacterium]
MGVFRRIAGILCLLVGLVIVLLAITLAAVLHFNAPPADSVSGEILFEVREGESALAVGKRLEEEGLIKNRNFWYLLARIDKEYIKTGTYLLEFPQSQLALRSVLVSGRQLQLRVTIPEGVTLKKAGHILEEAEICPAGDFLDASVDPAMLEAYGIKGPSMEGFLYPETYFFPKGYPADKVVQVMADTFRQRLEAIDPKWAGLNADEIYRRVIIASIVEREYRVDEEAALMAGVFYNRLKIGMALQSCATVEYIITEIQGKPHPEVLYTRDTEIRDPYNTYIRPGLPPGPISAPGETALRAAFSPEASDYLYFRLVDASAGRHYFSRTLDDHIKAGRLYVKGGGGR